MAAARKPSSSSPPQRKPKAQKRSKKAHKRGKSKTALTASRQSLCCGFPKFRELPPELRLAIWELALAATARLVLPRYLGYLGPPYHRSRDRYNISHVGPPTLVWVCREARAVAFNGITGPALRGGWVDPYADVLFIRAHENKPSVYSCPARQILGPTRAPSSHKGVLTSVRLAPQIAIEIVMRNDGWAEQFVQYIVQCQKLARLFLVVRCERPSQYALERGWFVAREIHKGLQAAGPGVVRPPPSDKQPPLEIVILLKRRKYAFGAGIGYMDLDDFLTNFTAVPYKLGHQAKIGRHGVLKSILPI